MKQIIFLAVILNCCAIKISQAKTLQARFAHATFYTPEKGPYIETYLSVSGSSVKYVPVKEGKSQASIEVSIIYKQGEIIKFYDKYNLLSPEETVDEAVKFNFLDQQRVSLPNGNYQLELSIRDKNSDLQPYTLTQAIQLEYYPNIVSVSDIELLDGFTKVTDEKDPLNRNGYKLIPLVDNFFPDEVNTFKFYAEVYNTSALLGSEEYLLTYHIETFEGKQILENFKRFSKQQPKPVNVLLTEFDIKDLLSGNYNLVIEIRNRNNELLAIRKTFFQRSKSMALTEQGNNDFRALDVSNTFVSSITNKDSLAEYINCIRPISGTMENLFADNQLELADVKMMQQFFYAFWQRKNPENPYMGWMRYKAEVDKVNAQYSGFKIKGYDTDQGRVYLQYGPANSISKNENEPSTYPYEIWHYYKIKNQSNRKFVFYNSDLISRSFTLLHSDAVGEVNDPQWQLRLYKRTVQNSDFDTEKVKQGFGQHSENQFKNPH